jgi:hypothetical protein
MNDTSPRHISRRTLLAGAAGAALAASGCRSAGSPPAGATPPPPTTASLTATSPFYIAHRGGGGNWPEMTAYAYEQASQIPGLQALEISVCLTSDGVLVCSHDPTTERVTGQRHTIADEPWSALAELRVSASETTDPRQPAQPFARFEEVFERYIDRFVLFVEPKVSAAEAPLLRVLSNAYSPERIVWKQPLVNNGFTAAKQAGFSTWAYVLDAPSFLGQNLSRLASPQHVDMLGIPVHARPGLVRAVSDVAGENGQKTIAWAITSTAERDLALAFGAAGLMTSNVTGVVPRPTASPTR